MNLILVLLGLVVLYFGGELLVKHASGLGRLYGLSPMVVGLTIVAFGTSSPELATSLLAVARGASELALGNVVGSNSANLGLILGIAAIVYPVAVKARFLQREGLFMLFTSGLLLWVARSGEVGRGEGIVLFGLLVGYIWVLLRARATPEVEAEFREEFGAKPASAGPAIVGTIAGVVLLVLGAELLVRGAVGVARQYGVSERVIGLTMVAFGTSVPELAASVVAAIKREGDIIVGNLVGSNIFNVLAVLGLTASVKPVAVNWMAARIDILAMLGITVLTLGLLHTRKRVARIEGVVLLVVYCAYIAYISLMPSASVSALLSP